MTEQWFAGARSGAGLANITALRAVTWPGGRPALVQLSSNWIAGDDGGVFRWNATSTAADDGGTTIKETATATGRWERLVASGPVDTRWWSATVHLGVQGALNAGYDTIQLPNFQAPIEWLGQVNIPQDRRIEIIVGNQTIFVAPNITALSYRRNIAQPPTSLSVTGAYGLVVENGLGRTSVFCDFRGAAVTAGMTITRSGSTATVALPADHLLATGQTVEIQGANQPEYNGRFAATVTGARTFTYTVSGSPATPATGPLCYSGQETSNFNDSRVEISGLEFRGFFRSLYTERTGGGLERTISRFNGIHWESGRDSSFFDVNDLLSVNDVTTIYYLDVAPNGLSNGVRLEQVYSVLAGGIGSLGGINMTGIEGMTGGSNSVDLCYGATYGLNLNYCTSLDLSFVWMASDLVAAPTHRGWYLEDAFRSCFRVATNVNSFVFGWVQSQRFPTTPLYLQLDMPLFWGNANAGVIFNNAIGVSLREGYKFTHTFTRTGTDYEFVGINTCNYNTIGQGHMRGTSYSIGPGLGAGSVVVAPVFIP